MTSRNFCRELLESAVERGVVVRPPIGDTAYAAFCDPSGGMSDAFTCSIAHKEPNGRIVVDNLYERRAPFNPSEVIEDISRLLKAYRITEVTGDRYAAAFVVEAFGKCGIQYVHSRLDRSEVYLGFLPLVTAGQVLLIDHPRAIAQFAALERRTFSSGKDKVDHPIGGHDDLSNAIAGACTLAAHRVQQITDFYAIAISKSDDASLPDNRSTTQRFYDFCGGTGSFHWGHV
jgi:hypothetical protein